jgi:hypothetical protein
VIFAEIGSIATTSAQRIREGNAMRRLFTVDDARRRGVTDEALRWGIRRGRWRLVMRGVYIVGAEEASALERAIALVLVTGGVAMGALAGVLLEFDSVVLRPPYAAVWPTSSGRRAGVRHTIRRLAQLVDQARRRPLPA